MLINMSVHIEKNQLLLYLHSISPKNLAKGWHLEYRDDVIELVYTRSAKSMLPIFAGGLL